VGFAQAWDADENLIGLVEVDAWSFSELDVKDMPQHWTERGVAIVVGGLQVAGGWGMAVVGAGMCSSGIGCGVGITLMFVGADYIQSGVHQAATGNPSPLVGEMTPVVGPAVGQAEHAVATGFGVYSVYSMWKAGRSLPSCATAGTCTPAATAAAAEPLGTWAKTPRGSTGVQVPGRLSPAQMEALTNRFGVEFALIYRTGPGANGGGGTYWLYSGTVNTVSIPVGGYCSVHISHAPWWNRVGQ